MAFLDGFSYETDARVEILGVDVTDDLSKINGLEQLLDYPTPTQFVASDVEIVLVDIKSRYNPQRPDNFFVRAAEIITGQPSQHADIDMEFTDLTTTSLSEQTWGTGVERRFWRDAYGVPVKVFLTREDKDGSGDTFDDVPVFSGIIIDIDYDGDPPTTRIILSDMSQRLRNAVLSDFGIERALGAFRHPDFKLDDGVYFIPGGYVSEDSIVDTDAVYPFIFPVTGYDSADPPMPILGAKQRLNYLKEGGLTTSAQIYDFTLDLRNGLLSGGSGGFTQDTFTRVNLRFKQAYRHKTVEAIVREIVEKYDLADNADINIPNIVFPSRVYQTHGSLSWHLEGDATGSFPTDNTHYNDWEWRVPTKFGFSASRGDKGRFYFQYQDEDFHYDVATDTFAVTSDTPVYATGNPSNASFRNGHLYIGGQDYGLCWRSVLGDPLDFPQPYYGMHVNHPLGLYVVEAEIDGFTEYHFFAGYGQMANLEEGLVGNANSLDRLDFHNADILGNWQWLSLSRRCNQKIPLLDTNGLKAWDVLVELARLVNCAVGFETLRDGTDRFFFRPHDKVIGTLSEYESGSTTQSLEPTATGPIVLDDNSAFPIGGDILVVSKPGSPQEQIEPMRYGGKRGTRQLTNLERGEAIADFVPGVIPVQHDYPGQVYLIKKVVENTQSGGSIIDIQIDAQFEYLANVVGVRYGGEMPPIRDEDSIAAYGEKTETLALNILDFHQGDWVKWIADAYIEDYSRANYFVNLVLTFSPDVEVGSTVLVTQRRRSHLHYTPVRVLRVLQDYENSQTQIAGRTLFRHSRAPEAGGEERERPTITTGDRLAFMGSGDIQHIWRTDGYASIVLPSATGGTSPYRYELTMSDDSDLTNGFFFEPANRELYTAGRYTGGTYEGFGPPEGAYSFKYKVIDSSQRSRERVYPDAIEIAFEELDTWTALATSGRRMYVVGSDKCRVFDINNGRVFSGTGDGFADDLNLPAGVTIVDATFFGGSVYLLTSNGRVLRENATGGFDTLGTLPTGEWVGLAVYNGGYVVLNNQTGKLMASDGTTEVADLKVVGNYKAIEIVGTALYALLADCSYVLTWDLGAENTRDFGNSIPLLRGSGEWVGLAYSSEASLLFIIGQNATRAIAVDASNNRRTGSDVRF